MHIYLFKLDTVGNNDGLREDTASVETNKDVGWEDSRIGKTNGTGENSEMVDIEGGGESKKDCSGVKKTGETGQTGKGGQSKKDGSGVKKT